MWITMCITTVRKDFNVDNFVDNSGSYPQVQDWDCG